MVRSLPSCDVSIARILASGLENTARLWSRVQLDCLTCSHLWLCCTGSSCLPDLFRGLLIKNTSRTKCHLPSAARKQDVCRGDMPSLNQDGHFLLLPCSLAFPDHTTFLYVPDLLWQHSHQSGRLHLKSFHSQGGACLFVAGASPVDAGRASVTRSKLLVAVTAALSELGVSFSQAPAAPEREHKVVKGGNNESFPAAKTDK